MDVGLPHCPSRAGKVSLGPLARGTPWLQGALPCSLNAVCRALTGLPQGHHAQPSPAPWDLCTSPSKAWGRGSVLSSGCHVHPSPALGVSGPMCCASTDGACSTETVTRRRHHARIPRAEPNQAFLSTCDRHIGSSLHRDR